MIKAKNNKNLKSLIENEVLKGKLKFEDIDVSNIKNFSHIFINFEFDPKYGSIENWNVSKGLYFIETFLHCKNIWFNFKNWNMTNAIDCSHMFGNCQDFLGIGLEYWNLKNVKKTKAMFADCYNLDIDVSNWNMSKALDLSYMFYNCYKFRGIGLDKWNIILKNQFMENIFFECYRLDFDISNWKFSKYFELQNTFFCCINFKGKGFDKIEIKNFTKNTFFNCHSLQILPKTKEDYEENLHGCYSLENFNKKRFLDEKKFYKKIYFLNKMFFKKYF